MRLAKKLWPDLTHSNNQYLRYYFRIDPGEVGMAHNALADAVVTAHILMYELREVQRRRENNPEMGLLELQKWIDSPMLLGTCRFGNKHWGQPWKDVPKSYLRWMSENVKDMDRDTAFTVRHYLQ
jgi:DNA polymerase III epsilon subunit-like protein